jgi:uncharacterized protein YceH (UPF0502 family)
MEIDRTARRVLGALLEKRWTTPEQYPLTVNALVLACNQKSNRDPEVHFEAFLVEGCLYQLRLAEMVMVVERDVGRTVRYAERLSEKLDLSRQQQAIVAELMLRGPQTANELLRRCERMAHFENEGEVENLLRGMAERGWARLLAREARERHPRWTHLFAPAGEAADEPAPAATAATAATAVDAPRSAAQPRAPWADELDALRAEIAELRTRVERLEGGG